MTEQIRPANLRVVATATGEIALELQEHDLEILLAAEGAERLGSTLQSEAYHLRKNNE